MTYKSLFVALTSLRNLYLHWSPFIWTNLSGSKFFFIKKFPHPPLKEYFLTITQSFSQLSLTMTFDLPDQCSDYSCTLSLEFALFTPTLSFPLTLNLTTELILSPYCCSFFISLHPTQFKIVTVKLSYSSVNLHPQKPSKASWQ